MKKILFILLIPFVIFATHGSPRIEDSVKGRDTIIKVLTHENLEGALIEIKGPYTIKNPSTNKKIQKGYSQKRHFLSSATTGLKWGKVFSGNHQIKIIPKKGSTFLINGIQYSGNLYAYSIASNICLVVEIDVDSYVKSILSAEFSHKKLHQSTMESLAVAMRTTLYQKISSSSNPFWDIKASEHQFRGCSLLQVDSRVDAAVCKTKDLILIHNNKPFPALWTENSSGKTAAYKVIFRKDINSPNGIFVPFAQKNRSSHSWKASISKKELEKIYQVPAIHSIETYQDKATQKIYGIYVKGKNLSFREIPFVELQEKIGKNRILSNDCSVKLVDKRIEFTGYGKGLGVGICLYSANQMADNGKSSSKILSTFFPETKIIKLEHVPQVFFDNNDTDTEKKTE